MRFHHRSISTAFAATFVAACASAPIQRAYVAPNQQTVYTTTEEMSATPGAVIYVENHSSVRVTVYSATLRGCENIKGPCDSPRPLSLRIDPDSRALLVRGSLRVLPDSIVIPVGRRASLDTVRVLLIGTQGETLGRIRTLQWRLLGSPAITLTKPDTVVAVAPGRTMLQLRLPDDVLAANPALHTPLQVPIVVRP